MTTLKNFVKETLSQISDAIVEFDEENSAFGASANPPLENHSYKDDLVAGVRRDNEDRWDTIVPIEFDIAVTATDTSSSETGGGIKVVAAVINLTGEGKTENQTESMNVSRVKFRLPFRLPNTGQNGTQPGRDEKLRQSVADTYEAQTGYNPLKRRNQ